MAEFEPIRFDNFRVGVDSVEDIGKQSADDMGVADKLRLIYGYKGTDWEGLIGSSTPNRELQKDIQFGLAKLSDPSTQKALGYQEPVSGWQVAHDLCVDAGLQTEVFRPFAEPADTNRELHFKVGVIPDRVPNWLERMADEAVMLGGLALVTIDDIYLASSTREIGPGERAGVTEGTPAATYMEESLLPRLEKGQTRSEYETGSQKLRELFKSVRMARTGEKAGEKAMAKLAEILMEAGVDVANSKFVTFAVAGNWPQTGAQVRQGIQNVYPDFDRNPENRQLWVKADGFGLGITGDEPKTTHQNPVSGVANIERGLMYFDRSA